MDSQLVALGPIFERECHHVASHQVLPTKLRFILEQGHICDLFFRSRTGGYSYTLVKDGQRVMGWDNAPHHHHISTAPHHFHTPEGTISASLLVGDPAQDVIRIARAINHYLETGTSSAPVL